MNLPPLDAYWSDDYNKL